MHRLQARTITWDDRAAKLLVASARKAFVGVTASDMYSKWLAIVGHPSFKPIRLAISIVAALAADDIEALDELLPKLDEPQLRHRGILYVHEWRPEVIEALTPRMARRVAEELPLEQTLAWVLEQPCVEGDRMWSSAAVIAAQRPGPNATKVVARVSELAPTHSSLANGIATPRNTWSSPRTSNPLWRCSIS